MNVNIKFGLQLFAIGALFVVIAFVFRNSFAWTNPTSNPPGGSGVITVSGGNVGIGTVIPSYKLDVNGTINGTSVLNPTYAP